MKRLQNSLFFVLLTLIPSQIGVHLWFPESLVLGRRIDYLAPTIYLSDLILFATAIAVFWQYRWIIDRHIRLIAWGAVVSVLLMIVNITLGQALSTYAFFKLLKLATFAGIIWLRKTRLSDVYSPLAIGVGYTVLLAVAQFLLQRSVGGIFYFLGERAFTSLTPAIARLVAHGQLLLRPYATFPHPNVMGGYLTVLLSLFLLTPKPEQKHSSLMQPLSERLHYLLHQTTNALILLGIFLSFSRASWLVAIGVCFIAYLHTTRRRVVVWGMLGLTVLFAVEEAVIGRFASLFTFDSQSWWERQQLIRAALSMIAASPLWGVGLSRFIPSLPDHSYPPFMLQPVHNVYLLLFAETGMIGVLIFGLTVGLCIKRALVAKWLPLVVALAAILVLGVFDHYFVTIQQTILLFTLMLALTLVKNSHGTTVHT